MRYLYLIKEGEFEVFKKLKYEKQPTLDKVDPLSHLRMPLDPLTVVIERNNVKKKKEEPD